MKKLKKNEGITLVALVVTIIVLLILAGVALSAVLSQDGIFHRSEQAVDKHGEAKARETLELALGEAQMQKYEEGLTDEQLTEKINTIGEELPKEKPEHPELQNVIVDGHIFEIDRSVPKIVDYIGSADGVIITAQITQNGWTNSTASATVTGTIKTYSGGNITNSTAIVISGNANVTGFPINGGSYTISNIAEDTDIKITATDSNGKSNEKTINVRLIKDTTAPTITSFEAKAEGLKITISATAEDSESGMQSLTYNITSEQDTVLAGIPEDKRTGTLKNGTVTIQTTQTGNRDETIYKITVMAKDNADNETTSSEKEVKTEDIVYKHIKTPEGLKSVKVKDVYGLDILGYDCTKEGVSWQIFYIDEVKDEIGNVIDSQVYLISKEYMVPPNANNMTKGLYSHTYYWSETALDKYKTTIPNTPFTAKFLSDYANTDASSREDLQATNYMLDQNMWSEYLNTTKANYAFGGPTLPLFQASYNDICTVETKLLITNTYSGVDSGYQVTKGRPPYSVSCGGLGDETLQRGIYFQLVDDTSGAAGMWLCSPSWARYKLLGYDTAMVALAGRELPEGELSIEHLDSVRL